MSEPRFYTTKVSPEAMRYQILMGTDLDLHHIASGETLPAALLNLLTMVLDDGDEDEIADLNHGLESLETTALIEAMKQR